MAEHLHQTQLLSEYLEGELSMIQRQAVEAHFRICSACRQELNLLRQTVYVLHNLPLLTTPADFGEKLHQQLKQKTKGHQDPQGKGVPLLAAEQPPVPETAAPALAATASPPVTLMRKAPRFGRIFQFPLQVQIPLYACVALLGLSIVRSHITSEKPTLAPEQPQVAPHLESSSRQVTTVAGNTIQPVDATIPSPEQPLLLDTTLPTAVETFGASQPLRWRVAGSEPALLRRQVKELARQIEGATILQEQEELLLISVPTQELGAFREKLTKLGTATNPENELIPHASTTLLSITFVREPSLASPPPIEPQRLEGRS
jgi:hypothetical protein